MLGSIRSDRGFTQRALAAPLKPAVKAALVIEVGAVQLSN